MKVNKYITDKRTDNLGTKLLSYSAMAAAFMVSGGEAQAQCGTAAVGAPLGVDIDGDGTDDLSITINQVALGPTYGTSTVPVAATSALLTTQTGTLTASLPIVPGYYFTYYGCNVGFVSALYGYGFYGGSAFNVPPGVGGSTLTGTAPLSLQVNALGVYNYYFNYVNPGTTNIAYAAAAGSNQIVGLSAAGTNVCAVIDSSPGVAGPNSVALGSANSNGFVYTYANTRAASVQYLYLSALATVDAAAAIGATTTCLTVSYSYFGVYLPPIPVVGVSAPSSVLTTLPGPFAIGSAVTSYAPATFQNTNTTTHLAVQFIGGGGETHNGWVEISIDPVTSEVTCVGSGYQQCSLETAAAVSGDAANGCMMVGGATNQNPACVDVADIPTTGEWGLIILGLMMSITAIIGIRQRREEEAVA